MSQKQEQLPIFNQSTLNIECDLKECCRRIVKESGISRDHAVDKMNMLAGRFGIVLVKGNGNGLTIETFEKWINPNDTSRPIPLKGLMVFCAVFDTGEPLNIMARPLELRVIGEREQRKLKWADANLKKRQALRDIRKIESEMEI